MTGWKTTNKFGLAIWNFTPESDKTDQLQLLIGEPLHICEETDEWYYGYSLVCDSDKSGIFPKNFIFTKSYEVHFINKYKEDCYKYPFQDELIFTLREWFKTLKKHYIDRNISSLKYAIDLINEIVSCYQRVESGKMTNEECQNLKFGLIEKLDVGNKLFGLDLVIRDGVSALIVNPFETSIIDFFKQHCLSDQRSSTTLKRLQRNSAQLQQQQADRSSKLVSTFRLSSISYGSNCSSDYSSTFQGGYNICSYSICVTLINFICTVRQDKEILMALYDVKSNRFISENFLVKWDKQGLVQNIDKLNNIRVQFTDISKKDLHDKKLFLVCQIVRVGTMNIENQKTQYRKSMHSNSKKSIDELRRPCGIAVYDLADFINNPDQYDENREVFFPFIPYSEKDSLNFLIRKTTKDMRDQRELSKNEGFHITIRLLTSNKATQHTSYVARKMGFPDIIIPEDFRNDLYLTLVSGEFNRASKNSERNIEVSVRVIGKEKTENGKLSPIDDALNVGIEYSQSTFKSMVYYHEDRPKWMETIKVALSIEDFERSHLKFTFKHRSSNESKDKNEKPFAIAFIRLMNENGTTLSNSSFDLFVYKVDGKKYNEADSSYLSLPYSRSELEKKFELEGSSHNELKQFFAKQFPSSNFTYSPKDTFTISIVVCSTKLAQNFNIFSLLNWKEKKDKLKEILENIKTLEGEDVVKFLHDALDALFDMWMDDSTQSAYDPLLFNALVTIVSLLLKERFMNFQQILTDYIEKNFSATLIYAKLIRCFKRNINHSDLEQMYKTIACMEYIFKFIVRSRTLFTFMNGNGDKEQFESSLEKLLLLFANLMANSDEKMIKVRSGVLKYFPHIIADIVSVYEPRKLSLVIVKLLEKIPINELWSQKLTCIKYIVPTELFANPSNFSPFNYGDCRREILPIFAANLRAVLLDVNEYELNREVNLNEKVSMCLNIISDILNIIGSQEKSHVRDDIYELTVSLLPPLINAFICVESRNNCKYVHQLLSIIISMLNQMTDHHYSEFYNFLGNSCELNSFLLKLLHMFKCCTKMIFPVHWSDMHLLQNMVMLKTMTHVVNFAKEPSDLKRNKTDLKLYEEIFLTSIAFITQPSLQLENFSKLKRKRIKLLCRDMRLEMAILVRSLWFYLGDQKRHFIPSMIGPLLEVALTPGLAIRRNTNIIFGDMFYFCTGYTVVRNEVITKLDSLIAAGRGDLQFKKLFECAILKYCENHPYAFQDYCNKFVREISQQIEKLLVYREVVKSDDGYESLMSCITDLLDFYDRIERREMYIRYLYKLYDLHMKYQNYSEAAYTLAKHSVLLEWSEKPLDDLLRNEKYQNCNTHRELKEKLYEEILSNFNDGQLWEAGIVYCKELVQQYENVFYDYDRLSNFLGSMSSYYKLIMSSIRLEPEYFHVAYYGNGFPPLLRGKTFIYRGKGYERLVDFCKRMEDQFPKAKLLNTLDAPNDDIIKSNGQYLSIFSVEPIMEAAAKSKFSDNFVDEKIVKYYQFNEISEFMFSRRTIKENHETSNEFACMWIERTVFKTAFPLPGILCRSEVVYRRTYELNPLHNAIDTMEKVSEKTRAMILRYLDDHDNPLHIYLMHINGIVNSDVQGGVIKYEEAFFQSSNSTYRQEDIDKLKELMARLIPLLDLSLRVIEQKQPSQLAKMDGLYRHIVESFNRMRDNFEEKYGKRELPNDLLKIKEHRLCEPTLENHRLSNASNYQVNDHRNGAEITDGNSTITKARSKFSKLNGSTTNLASTLRLRKKETRRQSSASDSANSVYASSANISQTQWYTDSKNSPTNLTFNTIDERSASFDTFSNEQRVPHNSRPSSGHYNHRASIQSMSVYHFCPSIISLSTSQNGENPDVPPPLPAKQTAVEPVALQTKFERTKTMFNTGEIYQPCKKPEENGL